MRSAGARRSGFAQARGGTLTILSSARRRKARAVPARPRGQDTRVGCGARRSIAESTWPAPSSLPKRRRASARHLCLQTAGLRRSRSPCAFSCRASQDGYIAMPGGLAMTVAPPGGVLERRWPYARRVGAFGRGAGAPQPLAAADRVRARTVRSGSSRAAWPTTCSGLAAMPSARTGRCACCAARCSVCRRTTPPPTAKARRAPASRR